MRACTALSTWSSVPESAPMRAIHVIVTRGLHASGPVQLPPVHSWLPIDLPRFQSASQHAFSAPASARKHDSVLPSCIFSSETAATPRHQRKRCFCERLMVMFSLTSLCSCFCLASSLFHCSAAATEGCVTAPPFCDHRAALFSFFFHEGTRSVSQSV